MAEKSASSILVLLEADRSQPSEALQSRCMFLSCLMDWGCPAVKSRHSCLMLAQCLCFINSKCLVAMVALLDALECRATGLTHRVVMCKGSLWKAD